MRGRLAESLLDELGKHAASGQSQKGLPQVGVAATNSYQHLLVILERLRSNWMSTNSSGSS